MWCESEKNVKLEIIQKDKFGIVQDEKVLRQVSEKATFEEAVTIWEKLEKILGEKKELALSAIQIGIPKRVALIKLGNKVFKMLNTIILNRSEEFVFHGEGCLSFPKIFKNTLRYKSVEIQDESLGHFIVNIDTDNILPILFQHEVDHMDGVLFFDRMQKPVKVIEKIGRNDLCLCGSNKKYKKCCGR
jgi:peptide deformylase